MNGEMADNSRTLGKYRKREGRRSNSEWSEWTLNLQVVGNDGNCCVALFSFPPTLSLSLSHPKNGYQICLFVLLDRYLCGF
jgi:hypothetical protein